jgi:hypothetical protein
MIEVRTPVLIDGGDARFLAALFAGRDPWMHDFF